MSIHMFDSFSEKHLSKTKYFYKLGSIVDNMVFLFKLKTLSDFKYL